MKSLKNIFLKGTIASAILGVGVWVYADDQASAHGYIKEPASRGYVGAMEKQDIGWEAAIEKYGKVVDSPQSIEGPKGFPVSGPIDGQIASAGGGLGQIDFVLDRQSREYWKKHDMLGGVNTFTWHYTAPHATSKWHYYITKKGWNPNDLLERHDFELIGTVDHNGSSASNNLSHQIHVPTDRNGYHVILGVWDVADTSNAFYNVIDVNLINEEKLDEELPSIPTNLHATSVSNQKVELSWDASVDNVGVKEYAIFRNNKKISTSLTTSFIDTGVISNTTYSYAVKSIDFSGNASLVSEEVNVTTSTVEENDSEAPTTPSGLHEMKVTDQSVEIMWAESMDNVGVKEYVIYRDNKKIMTTSNTNYTDQNLKADTVYVYMVKAVDSSGNLSSPSNLLNVKTKENIPGPLEGWDPNKVYTSGMLVQYNDLNYKAKYWTQGNVPDSSSAWELMSDIAVEWNPEKPYIGGEKVLYQGFIYQAKWWTKGNIPGQSDVWIK